MGPGFLDVVMRTMDGCLLAPRFKGNKLDDNVGSDVETIIEGNDIDGKEPVDDNLGVLNHIALG